MRGKLERESQTGCKVKHAKLPQGWKKREGGGFREIKEGEKKRKS